MKVNIKTGNLKIKKIIHKSLGEKGYNSVRIFKFIIEIVLNKKYDNILPILPKYIRENSNILDIGANIGQYSVRLSKNNKNSNVYAFEPVNLNCQYLRFIKKVFRINNLHVYNLAISDKLGESIIKIPIINGVTIGTQASLVYDLENQEYKTETVKTITVDSFVSSNNLDNISLIKIDTEGHEDSVLKGANQTILKNKPIVLFEPNDISNINFLYYYDLGYRIFSMKNDKLIEIIPKIKINYSSDIIMIPNNAFY